MAQQPEPLWREGLGEVLRSIRRDRGWRLADVAARAGVSAQYLSEIERGRKDPSSEILAALADAMDLSTAGVVRAVAQQLDPAPVVALAPDRGARAAGRSGRPTGRPRLVA